MNSASLPVWFKTFLSALASIGAYFFGSADSWFYALIAFVVVDYLTGVMAAIIEKRLSSAVGFKGLFKKICIFAIVGVANILDNSMGLSGVLRIVIIGFFCANEALSVLENSTKMGVPIPQKLIEVLEQLKKKAEVEKGKNSDKEE